MVCELIILQSFDNSSTTLLQFFDNSCTILLRITLLQFFLNSSTTLLQFFYTSSPLPQTPFPTILLLSVVLELQLVGQGSPFISGFECGLMRRELWGTFY